MRDGTLTGGTQDVNPQWLKFSVTQTGADATTSATQALPVIRAREGVTPTIIEVLRVGFFPTNVSEVDSTNTMMLTTKNFGATAASLTEPSAIAIGRNDVRITTSGQISTVLPIWCDCTDGAGHGTLVATDNIYLQNQSANTGLTNTISCWILYRFKRVGTLEYVGIVQSQQ